MRCLNEFDCSRPRLAYMCYICLSPRVVTLLILVIFPSCVLFVISFLTECSCIYSSGPTVMLKEALQDRRHAKCATVRE
jgi:hypothetical protein